MYPLDFSILVGKKVGLIIPGIQPIAVECKAVDGNWFQTVENVFINMTMVMQLEIVDEKRIIAPNQNGTGLIKP